ncbi:ABC transporter permease, partial [Salmonella enterica subsp. enterica serovar Mikawasima]|nr:ABC transporter permease [Salmonella enterica subsp. enterica serovar Mikawasima]EHZ2999512.1 ABC transporter permease [Salmonella enterica subsp. enterica serovar Mikawasima]
MYISEALQNILENKRNIIVFMLFLIISFSCITITDSLIYSTSKKAEQELSLNGYNVITVEFDEKVSEKKIDELFHNAGYSISKSKKSVFTVGVTPYSDDMKMVIGSDKIKLSARGIKISGPFENNVILYYDNPYYSNAEVFFLDGLPFRSIGKIKKKKTEFLDSLGLSSFSDNVNYIIPLETIFRLTLDDSIDIIDLIKNDDITINDIEYIKNLLFEKNITKFSIHSVLDAKLAVNKVLERFSLLTNSIYTLLTVMMIIIIIMVCRKTFQSRSTEFALKLIHGVDKAVIIRTVIVELMIITFIGLFSSILLTIFMSYVLSLYLGIVLLFRFEMIFLSFLLVMFASYISGVYTGIGFFKENPV